MYHFMCIVLSIFVVLIISVDALHVARVLGHFFSHRSKDDAFALSSRVVACNDRMVTYCVDITKFH